MSQTQLQLRLAEAADQLGLELSAQQRQLLNDYLLQMQRWNKTYNLTAIRDLDQMLVQHVIDSLSVVAPLRTKLADNKPGVVADIGSGGGLPGVILAVACPHWTVYCVDAVEKKMAFVRQMSGVLGLPNLKAIHGRVEEIEPLQADIVVSRAFASLADFAKLAGRHVGASGCLVAMKGKYPQDEIDALHEQDNWKVQSVQTLTVPFLDAQRCLVWISQGNS